MRICLSIIWILAISACKVTEQLTVCPERATVTDRTGIDGCGKMLKMEDGKILLPSDEQLHAFSPGTQVAISFEIVDLVSICMQEDAVVQLSCLQPLVSPPCEVVTDVESSNWLKSAIATFHPSMVVRYDHRSQPVYHLFNRILDRWYDCHGRQLCREDSSQPCIIESAELENKVEIYVAHR